MKSSFLYSLLHLGGFNNDVKHYQDVTRGRQKILELGCGDGRLAAALINEERVAYIGIDNCPPLVEKARYRLQRAQCDAKILEADMLDDLPSEAKSSDAVVINANTLYCTSRHSDVIARAAAALEPQGILALDVYNPFLWHTSPEDASEADFHDEADDQSDLMVLVEDELGREWKIYERDPEVDAKKQMIKCKYDFYSASTGKLSEVFYHHYIMPDALIACLEEEGFDVLRVDGDFEGARFDPEESDHIVIIAAKR